MASNNFEQTVTITVKLKTNLILFFLLKKSKPWENAKKRRKCQSAPSGVDPQSKDYRNPNRNPIRIKQSNALFVWIPLGVES
ncbi:hypothetical protein TNCT_101132 [Trichonephila clavata]|uniref:Uncharacterized protein n=1 Tax=Trichonephila clavata TaxID=2740835 RepID=A0A8X6J7Y7_TRICU|nr:hypothetical protein TNCT_101132 [Trichonephila clavata]